MRERGLKRARLLTIHAASRHKVPLTTFSTLAGGYGKLNVGMHSIACLRIFCEGMVPDKFLPKQETETDFL